MKRDDESTCVPNRFIALIDMDCFYCQVETQREPALAGRPLAVMQHRGGIIAVNYEARGRGVRRGMSGEEARGLCAELELRRVPTRRGLADLHRYREAGERVVQVLQQFTKRVQRASIDEAYLDITEQVRERAARSASAEELSTCGQVTLVAGGDWSALVNEAETASPRRPAAALLLAAALVVAEIRRAVRVQTGFECSAGIADNKLLSKAACGLHKPARQTLLPRHLLAAAAPLLPLRSLRGLGGARGTALRPFLSGDTLAHLRAARAAGLLAVLPPRDREWLERVSEGVDTEAVESRVRARSVSVCQQWRGGAGRGTARARLALLADELADRLRADGRCPARLSLSVCVGGRRVSRSCGLARGSSLSALSATLLARAAPQLDVDASGDGAVTSSRVEFLGLSADGLTSEPAAGAALPTLLRDGARRAGGARRRCDRCGARVSTRDLGAHAASHAARALRAPPAVSPADLALARSLSRAAPRPSPTPSHSSIMRYFSPVVHKNYSSAQKNT